MALKVNKMNICLVHFELYWYLWSKFTASISSYLPLLWKLSSQGSHMAAFLSAILVFTSCLFSLTFLQQLTLDCPQPIPPTTPHKYLISFFVFLSHIVTIHLYLTSPPAQIITQASHLVFQILISPFFNPECQWLISKYPYFSLKISSYLQSLTYLSCFISFTFLLVLYTPETLALFSL